MNREKIISACESIQEKCKQSQILADKILANLEKQIQADKDKLTPP